jgi:hypothetical protein
MSRNLVAFACASLLVLLLQAGCTSPPPPPAPLPSQDFVVVNESTGTYHRSDCKDIAAGYVPRKLIDVGDEIKPCTTCKPPLKSDIVSSGQVQQPPRSPSDRVQCAAITKKGTRCSRNAQPGRAYCWQH